VGLPIIVALMLLSYFCAISFVFSFYGGRVFFIFLFNPLDYKEAVSCDY